MVRVFFVIVIVKSRECSLYWRPVKFNKWSSKSYASTKWGFSLISGYECAVTLSYVDNWALWRLVGDFKAGNSSIWRICKQIILISLENL